MSTRLKVNLLSHHHTLHSTLYWPLYRMDTRLHGSSAWFDVCVKRFSRSSCSSVHISSTAVHHRLYGLASVDVLCLHTLYDSGLWLYNEFLSFQVVVTTLMSDHPCEYVATARLPSASFVDSGIRWFGFAFKWWEEKETCQWSDQTLGGNCNIISTTATRP